MTKAERWRCIAEYHRVAAENAEDEARREDARERRAAIVAASAHYQGSPYRRAMALATDLKAYAANGWPRDRDQGAPPPSASPKRRAWFRALRSRDGVPLGVRQLFNIARTRTEIEPRCNFNACQAKLDSKRKGIANGGF